MPIPGSLDLWGHDLMDARRQEGGQEGWVVNPNLGSNFSPGLTPYEKITVACEKSYHVNVMESHPTDQEPVKCRDKGGSLEVMRIFSSECHWF